MGSGNDKQMIGAIKIFAETERLVLREWTHADIPPFAAINSNPDVMRYYPDVLTESETEAFYDRIQAEFERMGWGLHAVELKSTGVFIGYVGLHEIGFDADFTPGIEIGWRLDAGYHNQGYATEAAIKVLELARRMALEKVYSFTAVVNKPSERVMQKIGMEKLGEFDHPNLSRDSPLLRHVLYQIRCSS